MALVKKMGGQIVKKGGGSLVDGSCTDLVAAWKDYQTTRERENTNRTQIAADREVRLASIQAQTDVFHVLINKSFGERRLNFDQYFAILKDGFISGNDLQINTALTMIVEQIKVNPMAQAVQMMQQINDPDVKCIDI